MCCPAGWWRTRTIQIRHQRNAAARRKRRTKREPGETRYNRSHWYLILTSNKSYNLIHHKLALHSSSLRHWEILTCRRDQKVFAHNYGFVLIEVLRITSTLRVGSWPKGHRPFGSCFSVVFRPEHTVFVWSNGTNISWKCHHNMLSQLTESLATPSQRQKVQEKEEETVFHFVSTCPTWPCSSLNF